MQLIGNRFDEETILNAAYTFEQKENSEKNINQNLRKESKNGKRRL